jgi:hypothetical protein
MPVLAPAFLAAALLAAASAAQAAPFAITYSGTVAANPSLPGVQGGEAYSVTFVMDSGGTTAAGSRWLLSDLRCAIWRFGAGGQRTTLTHPLTGSATQISYGSGAAEANAAGTALTGMFDIGIYAAPATDYTVSGPIVLGEPVSWNVNGSATAFADAQGSFDDAAGGVPIDPQRWGRPVAVAGPCDDTPVQAPPPGGAQPVPALGVPALALLGLGAAGLGALRLRRKHS